MAVLAALPQIGLTRMEQLLHFPLGHALDLIDVARPLIVAIDLLAHVGMPLGVTAHEIGDLHAAHRLARRILAGNQINRLRLPPSVCLFNDVLNVADIYWHILAPFLSNGSPREIPVSVYQQEE